MVSAFTGVRRNPEKRFNQLKEKVIDQKLSRLVFKTNKNIMELFKAHGIEYIPFQLTYHRYRTVGGYEDYDPTRTPYKKGNTGAQLDTQSGDSMSQQQGTGELAEKGDIYKHIKNISLDLDQDFLAHYYRDKVDYNLWLSRKYPEVQRKAWWALKHNEEPPAKYKSLRKQFYKEMGSKSRPAINLPTFSSGKNKYGVWSRPDMKKSTIVGYVRSQPRGEFNAPINGVNSMTYGQKNWKQFTGKDVENFIENEDYIFRGNMRTFFSTSEDDKVRKILNQVLTQFHEELMDLDLNEIAQDPNEAENIKNLKADHKKFLQDMEEYKQMWKPEPQFPNIVNIRTWFLKKGIYKSRDFDEFLDKTPKGKANWIDRSVFLIANGVYAKALGQKTFRISADYAERPVPFKKGIVSGKAAYISKARRYKRYSKDRQKFSTQRQKDYEVWKAENATIGRGWKNRYDKGRSSKPKKDSPRYDWRVGKR